MCCPIGWLAKIIAAIGAINWGLVAFLRFNIVEYLQVVLPIPYLNMILYGIIGVSGIYTLFMMFGPDGKSCK